MKMNFSKGLAMAALLACHLAIFAKDDSSVGYYSEKISAKFPSGISGMDLTEITDFEKRRSGLGVGLSYRADDMRADIYIYDMGMTDIPDGISSGLAEMSLKWSAMEIEEQGRRRIYASLKELDGPRVMKLKSSEFLCKRYSFIEAGLQKESFLLLTCRGGNFIKIRLTYSTVSDSDVKAGAQDFLDSVAGIIETKQRGE